MHLPLFLYFFLGHLEGFHVLPALEEVIGYGQGEHRHRHLDHQPHRQGEDEDQHRQEGTLEEPSQLVELALDGEESHEGDDDDLDDGLAQVEEALEREEGPLEVLAEARHDLGEIRRNGLDREYEADLEDVREYRAYEGHRRQGQGKPREIGEEGGNDGSRLGRDVGLADKPDIEEQHLAHRLRKVGPEEDEGHRREEEADRTDELLALRDPSLFSRLAELGLRRLLGPPLVLGREPLEVDVARTK